MPTTDENTPGADLSATSLGIAQLMRDMPGPGAPSRGAGRMGRSKARSAEPDRGGEAMTAPSTTDDRPQPRSLIGEDGQHRLVRSGYMVVTVCRSCRAPLTSPQSVAR